MCRGLFRNRSYASLWSGQFVSWIGNSFHRISLLFLLMAGVKAGDRYIPLLTLTLVHVVAYLGFAPFAGVFVDRWDRKRTMIVADLLRAALVAAIPLLMSHGKVWLYAVSFLVTVVSLFFDPARNAALPKIVSEPELFMANSFLSTSESGAEVIGYFLGGVLVMRYGYASAFYFDSITFIISAFAIMLVTLRATTSAEAEGKPPAAAIRSQIQTVFSDVKEGFAQVRVTASVKAVFILLFLMAVFFGSVNYLLALFAENGLGLGPAAYGAIAGGITCGYLVGSLLVGFVGSGHNRIAMLGIGLAGMGVSIAWVGVSKLLWIAVAGAVFGGLFNPLYYVASRTFLQEVVPNSMLGRVFSLQFVVVQVGFVVSVAFAWALLPVLGVRGWLVLSGIALTLVGLVGPQVGLLGRLTREGIASGVEKSS